MMSKRFLLAIFAALSILPAQTQLVIRPSSENVLHLYVEKTGIMSGKKHDFVFEDYEGQVVPDSSVRFSLKSASIVCKDTWVSEKDKKKVMKAAKEDMLAVDQYPEVTYQSTNIKAASPNEFDVAGNLTIRDKTQPVGFKVKQSSPGSYEGTAKFKLTAFGLKPPSAGLGFVGTKDEVTFVFSLRATK